MCFFDYCVTFPYLEWTFRCFCFAETGERIFGWEWWRDADDMTCACSRQRFKAEASGRLDVTLHCLPNGNFESLQCDMGICWCAEELTGQILPKTFAVPESLWTYLPCCKGECWRKHRKTWHNSFIFRQRELSWRSILEKVRKCRLCTKDYAEKAHKSWCHQCRSQSDSL